MTRLDKDLLLRIIEETQQEYICEERTPEQSITSLLRSALVLTASDHGCIYLASELPGQPALVKNIAAIISNKVTIIEKAADYSTISEDISATIDLFAGEAARTHKPILVNNLSLQHPILESCLIMPVMVKNRLLGMIGLASESGEFSRNLIHFLAPFLSTCALVLQKVSLHSKKQDIKAYHSNDISISGYTTIDTHTESNDLLRVYPSTSESANATKGAEKKLLQVLKQSLDQVIEDIINSGENLNQSNKTLEALKQEKERLKLALWVAELGLWSWKIKSGKVDDCQCWTEVLGYGPEEIQPNFNGWAQLIHPEDIPWVKQQITNHLNGVTSFYRAEHRLKSKNGGWKSVWLNGILFSGNYLNEPIRFAETHLDIIDCAPVKEKSNIPAIVAHQTNNAVIVTDTKDISVQTDYTASIQAEQLLSFQSDILSHVKDSVIVTDLSGTITYYNKGAQAIFGYTAEEMLGNTLLNLYPEAPDPELRKQTLERIMQGTDYDGEWQGKHKNGELVWVHIITTLMRDKQGNITGMIGVAKDITDRKKTEQKLRASESCLRSILDATVQTYLLLDSSFQIIKFNQVALEVARIVCQKELQVGESMLNYISSDEIESFKINMQKAFSGEKVCITQEYKHLYSKSWYEIQYLPAYNEQNQIYAIAFTSLDVTARKQTEFALMKSYQEVQNLKNALNASALISITNAEGTIIEVNQAFCDVSKYSSQELIGKNHNIINSGYHTPEFFSSMWQTISKGKSWRDEIKNKAKDGSFYWVDTTINPVFDETGKINQYISVRYLITQRKKAEEDKEKLITDLTKFAFITAHNLRGPLARVLGLISIFNPSDPMDSINATVIDKLRISANELDEVIHKMIHSMNIRENGKEFF